MPTSAAPGLDEVVDPADGGVALSLLGVLDWGKAASTQPRGAASAPLASQRCSQMSPSNPASQSSIRSARRRTPTPLTPEGQRRCQAVEHRGDRVGDAELVQVVAGWAGRQWWWAQPGDVGDEQADPASGTKPIIRRDARRPDRRGQADGPGSGRGQRLNPRVGRAPRLDRLLPRRRDPGVPQARAGRARRRRARGSDLRSGRGLLPASSSTTPGDRDPQLHIHNGVLNRVETPDGTWRTLDGRSSLGGAPPRARSPSARPRSG